jgi:hypothetical protein
LEEKNISSSIKPYLLPTEALRKNRILLVTRAGLPRPIVKYVLQRQELRLAG